jgi:hypothetical protein
MCHFASGLWLANLAVLCRTTMGKIRPNFPNLLNRARALRQRYWRRVQAVAAPGRGVTNAIHR